MRRLALAAALAITLAGCSKPNEPTRAACEVNNTGTIAFGNRSTHDQDIIWDGVIIFTRLAAGATSTPATEATAGVSHTLVHRNSNTQAVNCSAQPILIRCQGTTLTCSN